MSTNDAQHFSSTSSTASVSGDEHVAQWNATHGEQKENTGLSPIETSAPQTLPTTELSPAGSSSPSSDAGTHSGDLHTLSLNSFLIASDASLAVPPTDVPSRSTTPVSGMRKFRNRNAAANPGASLL